MFTFSPRESLDIDLDVDRHAVRDANFEILPLDPKLASPRLVRQFIHRPGRRPGDELSVRVKSSTMAWASKFRLLRMPADRAPEVRANRRQDGDSVCLPADPDGATNSSFLPSVLSKRVHGHLSPLTDRQVRKRPNFYETRRGSIPGALTAKRRPDVRQGRNCKAEANYRQEHFC